jgi:hypothetical protein
MIYISFYCIKTSDESLYQRIPMYSKVAENVPLLLSVFNCIYIPSLYSIPVDKHTTLPLFGMELDKIVKVKQLYLGLYTEIYIWFLKHMQNNACWFR